MVWLVWCIIMLDFLLVMKFCKIIVMVFLILNRWCCRGCIKWKFWLIVVLCRVFCCCSCGWICVCCVKWVFRVVMSRLFGRWFMWCCSCFLFLVLFCWCGLLMWWLFYCWWIVLMVKFILLLLIWIISCIVCMRCLLFWWFLVLCLLICVILFIMWCCCSMVILVMKGWLIIIVFVGNMIGRGCSFLFMVDVLVVVLFWWSIWCGRFLRLVKWWFVCISWICVIWCLFSRCCRLLIVVCFIMMLL